MSDKKLQNKAKKASPHDTDILRKQSKTACSDILGSYTGTAADNDVPEQDADDL